MPIRLDGGTTVSINEAKNGIKLGTLSGGNGTYEIYYSDVIYSDVIYADLFKTNSSNAQLIDGSDLFLSNDWYLDFETKTYTKHTVNQSNGKISSFSYITYTPTSSGTNPTVRIKSGSENQVFTISISDKNESISVTTPTPLIQNRYGAVIAQVNPSDSYFNSVYFQGPSFFEISGTNLKLTDDYYYSENGWILNSSGTGYNTSNSSQFSQGLSQTSSGQIAVDGNLNLNGSFASAASSGFSSPYRITITSSADDSGSQQFLITGTSDGTTPLTETVDGVDAATAISTKAFKTVTSITVKGAQTAGTVSAGISTITEDLKFVIPTGFTSATTDADGDGNADNGYTKLSLSSYINSFFGSSNINTTPQVTLTAVNFLERDYGTIIASINYSGTEPNVTFSIENHSFLEISGSNKIKLKDDYFYDEATGRVQDQSGSGWALASQSGNTNSIKVIVKNSDNSKNLVAETINISETTSTIFADSNVDGTAQITLTPVNFYDKVLGATIATINYTGTEAANFSLASHEFLEIKGGTNQLKLKDTYFYDKNKGKFYKKDLTGYLLSDQGSTYNKINILAQDSSSKKLAAELITFDQISNSVFKSSNVLDKDESYTFITDIKWVDNYVNYPKTGREEYQKDIGAYWVLGNGEKISYSFLKPGASYHGTYNELDGLIATTDAFETAAKNAFNLISSYTKITFEEVNETGDVVGDFRLGITDANHFGMDLSYGAYSQGVSHSPKGGNIFFNGTLDRDKDGICDYNEADKVGTNSWNFVTFLHEIIHSLGLKHPFEPFDSTDSSEGNANVMNIQYDQYPYTIMSYTPIRNSNPYTTKYDGINLNSDTGGQYYPSTPMLYDIMALQDMYGAATSNKPEDTTYTYSTSAPPFETIYDTGGVDTLNLSNLSGGAALDLTGNKLSTIGSNYLIPWKNQDSGTTYGTAQGSKISIISGTELEKLLLPSNNSTVKTGTYSTYIIGKENSSLQATMNSTELAIKSSGNANDTLKLNQTTKTWDSDNVAKNVGNNNKGSTLEEINMSSYLKHDISINLALGTDTIEGTTGNDALFLQNFATAGNTLYNQDTGHSSSSDRIINVENINLLGGNNFLDLTSTTSSLSGVNMQITSEDGNDILWLSDANETINTGDGDDKITVNGGTDSLTTGNGNDIIIVSNYTGNLTVSDFNKTTDKFVFKTQSGNVSTSGNTITASNSDGSYSVVLSNQTDLSDLSSYSTFL